MIWGLISSLTILVLITAGWGEFIWWASNKLGYAMLRTKNPELLAAMDESQRLVERWF